MNGLGDARFPRSVPAHQIDSLGRNGSGGIGAGEQPIGGPLASPVATQKLQQFGGKKGLPVLASFAVANEQHLAGAVDITHLQLGEFRYSQATTVEDRQLSAMPKVSRR